MCESFIFQVYISHETFTYVSVAHHKLQPYRFWNVFFFRGSYDVRPSFQENVSINYETYYTVYMLLAGNTEVVSKHTRPH